MGGWGGFTFGLLVLHVVQLVGFVLWILLMVKAYQGDRRGNLRFRLSARNFNPLAATAGRRTFAEVQHLVEVDELHPDDIHLPGVFVDDVVLASAASPRLGVIREASP